MVRNLKTSKNCCNLVTRDFPPWKSHVFFGIRCIRDIPSHHRGARYVGNPRGILAAIAVSRLSKARWVDVFFWGYTIVYYCIVTIYYIYINIPNYILY